MLATETRRVCYGCPGNRVVVQFGFQGSSLRDERLFRFAHPGLKSWAEARDSCPTARGGDPFRKRIARR